MSEHEPTHLKRNIAVSDGSSAVLRNADKVAHIMKHPLGLADVAFACFLDEDLRYGLQEKMGIEQADEAFRASSEALSTAVQGDVGRLLSMAKWLHGKGQVQPEDLYVAAIRLQQIPHHATHKTPIRRVG